MAKSWKPEVDTGDGIWTGNALRFATKEEAELYLRDLYSRWMSVRSTRAIECDLPVNYRWLDGKAQPVIPEVLTRKPVGYTEAEISASQARLVALFGEEELTK